MKRNRKIVFEIILFLAVLFCFGINTYSHSNRFEHSTGTNCVENNLMSEIDHIEDDEIIQNNEFCPVTKPINRIPIDLNCYIIHTFSWSIWQPPQIFRI
jgi:hypothetical protein